MFTVVLYETEDGKTPVEDWMDSLEPKMRATQEATIYEDITAIQKRTDEKS